MTEDEAKMKWCPFARSLGTLTTPYLGEETIVAYGSHNRGYQMGGGLQNCACIASACMAWRWGQKPNPSYNPNHGVQWPQPHPPVPMYIKDETTGACGLAN